MHPRPPPVATAGSQSRHQLVPHVAVLRAIRTNLLPDQLLVSRTRGTAGVHAQLAKPQAFLDRVVFGVFIVAPAAGERKPADGVPDVAALEECA